MKEIFKRFHELFTERCNNYQLVTFGEDSVRYDFFCAISQIMILEPWQIQLESSANSNAYKPRQNAKAKRKEKPMLDFILEDGFNNICIEFALFRQNSNDAGTINKTARTVKMLNDMIRIGLETKFSERTGYFVCVADDKMLGHQLRNKLLGQFPSNYIIDEKLVTQQMQTKTCQFDTRFIERFIELNATIKSTLVYCEQVTAQKIERLTKILVWEVQLVSN